MMPANANIPISLVTSTINKLNVSTHTGTSVYDLSSNLSATSNDVTTTAALLLSDLTSTMSEISSFEECNSNLALCQAQRHLFIYLTPFLVLLATVGNSLGLAVMTRPALRHSATAVFIGCLAVSDMTAVWTGLSRHFILKLTEIDVRKLSAASCKIQRFILYVSLDTSAWILAMITIERFLAVCVPIKHRLIKAPRTAAMIIAGIVTFQFAFNAHVFWTRGYQVIMENGTVTYETTCGYPQKDYAQYWKRHQGWLSMLIYSLIPATTMIILNSLIIRRLWNLKSLVKKGKKTNTKRSALRTSSMTTMLLTVTFYFVIVTTPVFLYTIIEQGFLYNRPDKPTDEEKARWELIDGLLTVLLYLNHSINFLLYCVMGRRFRRELCRMFNCCHPSNDSPNRSAVTGSVVKSLSSRQSINRVDKVKITNPSDPSYSLTSSNV